MAESTANSFPIQQQIHRHACIAASACSLLDALGITPPDQRVLDSLVQAGMMAGKNGFDSLRDALALLLPCVAVQRHTPAAADLVDWLTQQAGAHQGFLISHHVTMPNGEIRAHITVVFLDGSGSWFQADPADCSMRPISLAQLVNGYAGDVATISRMGHQPRLQEALP